MDFEFPGAAATAVPRKLLAVILRGDAVTTADPVARDQIDASPGKNPCGAAIGASDDPPRLESPRHVLPTCTVSVCARASRGKR